MDWPSDSNEDFSRTGVHEQGLQFSQKDSIVTDVSSRHGLQTDFDEISFAGEEGMYMNPFFVQQSSSLIPLSFCFSFVW